MEVLPNGCCHRSSSVDVMIGTEMPVSTGDRASCRIRAASIK
jgi:hypothetical protein